jgi:LPS-assembly lipoprotein
MPIFRSSVRRTAVVVLFVSLLSACGFQFRGEYLVPEDIREISVTSYDDFSIITRLVKEQLRLNNIDLVAPKAEIPNLHIANEQITERTLSLYQNTRTAEKELIYLVNYRVSVPDLGAKSFTATITRSYLDNPLTALAKAAEREMILNEMREFSAQQMMRQMARLKTEIVAYEEKLEDKEQTGNTNQEPAVLAPETP